MLILLLGACSVWKWAVLLTFQKNILRPAPGLTSHGASIQKQDQYQQQIHVKD
jgi:hypothetical protein